MKITGLLIDVMSNPGKIKEVEIEEERSLSDLYEALGCSTIDIVVRRIGGRPFDIVCDDEGLLKEAPRVSAVAANGEYMLVGNLFICNHYKEKLTSLSKEDVKHICSNVSVAGWAIPGSKEIVIAPILRNVSHV